MDLHVWSYPSKNKDHWYIILPQYFTPAYENLLKEPVQVENPESS